MEVLQHIGYFGASWPSTPHKDSLKWATLQITFLNKSESGMYASSYDIYGKLIPGIKECVFPVSGFCPGVSE